MICSDLVLQFVPSVYDNLVNNEVSLDGLALKNVVILVFCSRRVSSDSNKCAVLWWLLVLRAAPAPKSATKSASESFPFRTWANHAVRDKLHVYHERTPVETERLTVYSSEHGSY